MSALAWALASLALGLVLAVVFLSCIAGLILLVGGLRAHHRAGRERLRRHAAREAIWLAEEQEREAWQRIVEANRDIDVDLR